MAKRILFVDDEKDLVTLVTKRLKSAGYEVDSALDGKEGLEKVKQSAPDLIVLDILMPKVDGVAMATALKNNPQTKEIPIIFLTCLVENEEVKDSHLIAGGVFLAKPFDEKELLAMISKVLRKNETEGLK